MTTTPEPKDKLDATTTAVGEVNGPEDATLDWHEVDWRACKESVRRLRQRIFTASQAGASARLRALRACLSRMLGNGHVRF